MPGRLGIGVLRRGKVMPVMMAVGAANVSLGMHAGMVVVRMHCVRRHCKPRLRRRPAMQHRRGSEPLDGERHSEKPRDDESHKGWHRVEV